MLVKMVSLQIRLARIVAIAFLVSGSILPVGAGSESSGQTSPESEAHWRYLPSSFRAFEGQAKYIRGSLYGRARGEPPTRQAAEAKKGHPKLEHALDELVSYYRDGGLAHAVALAEERGIAQTQGEIRVVIETTQGRIDEIATIARSLGAKEETRHENLLQMRAPISVLTELADLPGVNFIRQPFRARFPSTGPTGNTASSDWDNRQLSVVISEGVQAIGADVWQNAGFRGQGVRIAIVDVGFSGYQSLLGAELPASVATRSFRADGDITGGGERHGTAVAEIVHSVAPDAELLLINFDTDVEWGNALDFVISQGVDVASSSVGFLFGPLDGTGFFAQKVNAVRDAGIFWAQSAGNYATEHWQGSFSDLDGNAKLEFAPGAELNAFSVPPDSAIAIFLSWDDWPASSQDYDLLLFAQNNGQWVLVDQSTTVQSGTQPPFEAIVGRTGSGGTFGVAIEESSATRNVQFQLYAPGFDLQFQVAATSLVPPADSPGAVTAGAVRVGTNELETFSSQGPTTDGRAKPDLVSPNGVSTATYGLQRFFGTSASAPHLAGAAALVKSANPALGTVDIQAFLEQRAVELGPPGKDDSFGAGRLDLGPPVGAQPGPAPGPDPGPAPELNAVDAKIEIVFPHDAAGNPTSVSGGTLANVGAFLFFPNSLEPVPCSFNNPLRLFRSLNNEVAEEVGAATPQSVTIAGRQTLLWQFDDVDVAQAIDPSNKYYFFMSVDGVPSNTNVWSHGEDARTSFPQQDAIAGLGPLGSEVDARIEVVFPHDAQGNPRPVAEADFVNLGVDVFTAGTLVSAPADAELTVRLYRSLNNDIEEFVGVAKKQIVSDGGVSHPRWLLDDIDVSAAKNPLNKYYFRVAVDGFATRSNTWSHGSDARTIFPEQDIPTSSCR